MPVWLGGKECLVDAGDHGEGRAINEIRESRIGASLDPMLSAQPTAHPWGHGRLWAVSWQAVLFLLFTSVFFPALVCPSGNGDKPATQNIKGEILGSG